MENQQIQQNEQIINIDTNITDNNLNNTIMDIYKYMVDYCKINSIKDYEVKRPLISYYNRDVFIEYIKNEITNT